MSGLILSEQPLLVPAPRDGGKLLTATDLAERWQVSEAHVYRLAREGDLPTVRIGRYRRFRLDQVERWERRVDSNTGRR